MIKEKPGQAGAVCSSCHQAAAGKLKESGSAHKKQPCVSCHRSHPPYGETVFSSCDVCHDPDDDQHFAVNNCQDCHQGHQPLGQDLSTAKNARPACQTCHAEVIAAFEAFPSAHAEQDCNRCHQRHGEALKCADCHEPHSPGMNHADCLNCHSSPHAPGQVAFAGKLPAGFCQSCHAPQVEALATSLAKHNQLTCLDCHQGTHGDRLECSSCHQPPHDPGLHRKFPDCLKCHIDPHNLADWRGSKDAALVNPEAVTTETQKKPAAPDAASSEDVK